MTISKEQAIAATRALLANELGSDLITEDGKHVVVLIHEMSEYDAGWLIPFNTTEYLEGGNPSHAMIPSAVLVPKDEKIRPHYPPSALGVETYLSRVASGNLPWFGQ